MLTNEIRVNGALLGHLYIINTMTNDDGKVVYSIEYYKTGKGIAKTVVLHDPADGAELLVAMAMTQIMQTKEFKEMTDG